MLWSLLVGGGGDGAVGFKMKANSLSVSFLLPRLVYPGFSSHRVSAPL